ncbi:MAG: NUDIX hydrolase [Burkholderiales bacterium]|nr:NUDIX hydrolase [Burkholderiales bacterium]MCE1176202.1 NUDIX hydrolase [Burkholderiales bacterium]
MAQQYDLNLLQDPTGLGEDTLSSELVYTGDYLKVYRDTVSLPNGASSYREYLQHPGAVMIIPVFENGDVLVERQYRYPMRKVFIEFPAGKKDAGEAPLETAQRELLEETGYTAQRYTHITDIHNALAYCDEVIHFYIAEDLHDSGQQKLDDNEFVQVMRVPLAELMNWIRQGWVPDVKTQLGAFWLQDYLSKKEV